VPRAQVDGLCILVMVWLDPRCATAENLDQRDLYRTNCEATKLAITNAVRGEPTIETLIANRDRVRHCMVDFDPRAYRPYSPAAFVRSTIRAIWMARSRLISPSRIMTVRARPRACRAVVAPM
jgi:hypothetical protein